MEKAANWQEAFINFRAPNRRVSQTRKKENPDSILTLLYICIYNKDRYIYIYSFNYRVKCVEAYYPYSTHTVSVQLSKRSQTQHTHGTTQIMYIFQCPPYSTVI